MEKETRKENHVPAVSEPEKVQGEVGNPYLVTFSKPFVFEGDTYTCIDLSGLENLSAADMIAANKVMERSGTVNVLPEMSLEYACILSSRASGLVVEFFKSLPPREAIKVKNCVTSFLYGGA